MFRERPLILIADDESKIRRVVAANLERSGFDVCSADDGRRALEIFEHSVPKPDLLVLDVMMPEKEGFEVMETLLLPDNEEKLKKELIRLADQRQADLILTTGGTGFAPTDVTPEATLAVADRMVPGIAEAMRAESMKFTKRAMYSRATSVLRKGTLIVNLPGSPKACDECLDVFLSTVAHPLDLLRYGASDCARK